MKNRFIFVALVRLLCAACVLSSGSSAAHEGPAGDSYAWSEAPEAVAVRGPLPAPPAGVTDLKFREFFKLPVGPKGLEPTEKFLSLQGKPVRMVGYMVKEEVAQARRLILAPLPLSIGDDDDSLADDLPPAVVYVRLPGTEARVVPHLPGLIRLTGILRIGAANEADGRVSAVRLEVDDALASALLPSREQLSTFRSEAASRRP